jgi:hypothetical protein
MAKATVALKAGETQETIQRTRIISPESEIPWWTSVSAFRNAEERPAFWDFIESLAENDWLKTNMRVWRYDPNIKNQLGAFITEIGSGPMNPKLFRDEVGGGKFKVYVRYGSILVYNEVIENAGAEKTYTAEAAPAAGNGDLNTQVLKMLRETLEEMRRPSSGTALKENAAADALNIQMEGFKNALTVQRDAAAENARPAGGGEMMDLMKPVLVAMLTKLIEPPKNPLETAAATIKMIQDLNMSLGGRIAEPSIGAVVAQQIPNIMQGLGRMMSDFRAAAEAGAAARGVRTVTVPAGPPPPPGGLPAGAPPPQPEAADARQRMAFEIMAGTVVTILNDASKSVQDRAEQALTFLETGAPVMVKQITDVAKAGGGAQAVLDFLTAMPILNEIPKHPNGKEFVEIFLREAEQPVAA